MTAGAAQTLAKNQWLVPHGRVLLVGSGPFQLPVAHQLIQGGATIAAVVESTRFPALVRTSLGAIGRPDRGLGGIWVLARDPPVRGAVSLWAYHPRGARGEQSGAASLRRSTTTDASKAGSERTIEVETICTAFGFLPSHPGHPPAGVPERFDAEAGGFVPTFTTSIRRHPSPGYWWPARPPASGAPTLRWPKGGWPPWRPLGSSGA